MTFKSEFRNWDVKDRRREEYRKKLVKFVPPTNMYVQKGLEKYKNPINESVVDFKAFPVERIIKK